MCFSAGASFSAGVVLTAMGAATLTESKKPSQLAFGIIPLFFAVQQLAEGFVWLSFTNAYYTDWQKPAAFIFLLFAQVIWPFWVPLSVLKLEQSSRRKKVFRFFSLAGGIVSLLLLLRLIFQNVTTAVVDCHITYTFHSGPAFNLISNVLYFTAVAIPLFLSTRRYIPLLGAVLLLSLIIARLFYVLQFLSVWCFFAALLSAFIFLALRSFRYKKKVRNRLNDGHYNNAGLNS